MAVGSLSTQPHGSASLRWQDLLPSDLNFNLSSNIVFLVSGNYAACGFQIQLVRKTMQYLVQVYLPSCMFVVVSWVSFLIKPEVVPGRMALLVTLFLVLINIFNSVRSAEPFAHKFKAPLTHFGRVDVASS